MTMTLLPRQRDLAVHFRERAQLTAALSLSRRPAAKPNRLLVVVFEKSQSAAIAAFAFARAMTVGVCSKE